MKQVLFSCLFLLIGTAVWAQKATIKGRITDAKSGDGLLGATAQIGSTGANTDLDGNYQFETVPGKVKITYSYVGYDDVVKEVTLANGAVQTIDIALAEKVDVLKVVTVTSGKFEKPLSEVTVSMSILKPTLIANSASASIDKALEKVPGVTIINGSANIRGGSGFSYGAGSRVLLLVNDMPALDPATGVPNFNDVPVENIEQVEVVKGASSALYGSSALNGIINVRTAFAKSKPITNFATFATGYDVPRNPDMAWWKRSKDSIQPYEVGGYASHRQKFGKFDLALGSYWFQQSSFRWGERSQYYRFNAYTRYRFSEKVFAGINFNGNVGRSQSFFIWNGSGAKALEPLNPSGIAPVLTSSNILRYMVDPYITFMPNATTTHKIQTRFSHILNDNGNNQGNVNNFMYGEYQFTKRIDSTFTIVAGVVGSQVDIKGKLYGFAAADSTQDATFKGNNQAVYLQLDKKFHLAKSKYHYFNISLGARYERNEQYNAEIANYLELDINTNAPSIFPAATVKESRPVFRAGINYQPAEYTWIRASAGQGYRYPSIAERFIQTRVDILNINPNPLLQPETGNAAEIAVKQGFKLGKDWKGYVDVSGFYNEYANMMEFTLGGVDPNKISGFQSVNIGDTKIVGSELELAGQGKVFGKETTILAGYTYIDPQYKNFDKQKALISDSTKNILKYRFQHTLKLDIESRLAKWASLGLSCQYYSRMENADLAFVGLEGGFTERLVPGMIEYWKDRNDFTIFDARIALYPSEHVKISFLAKNILNTEFSYRPALLEAPRNYTLRADFTF
jgi:outer membrane receptor protein involved in Fe transport